MGMSEQEFFHTTPVHFMRLRRAWLDNRQGMEEARFVAYHVMKAGGFKVRRLTDIIRFPWEEVQKIEFEPITKEELDRFSEEADRILEKTNPAAFARYMALKGNPTPDLPTEVRDRLSPEGRGDVENTLDPDFVLNAKLDF